MTAASKEAAGPRAFAWALLLGLALVGCVDQTKEVRLYRKVLDDSQPKAEPYKSGEILTLPRALELANADNEQLASQGETYLQAIIAKDRAFSAFLPTLSLQPNFTIEDAPRGQASASAAGAPAVSAAQAAATSGGFVQSGHTLHRFEAPVVGTMNFSFRNEPEFRGAEVAVAQQKQLLIDARASILLSVAQTFYQVVTSTKQVEVLEHSLDLQQARIVDIQGRLKAKLAMPLELSQAESDESATRVLLSRASSDVRNGRRTLGVLIGVKDVDGALADATLPDEPPTEMSAYVDHALSHRQDLAAAGDGVKAAHFAVKSAIAEYYPSASLDVAGYLYREDFVNASKWNGVLSANLPIFSGGVIRADVRDAWSRLRQAALFESYLKRQITEDVRTAYDNLLTSGFLLSDLRHEVEASSEAYQQAVEMEKNGLAIPLDVLTAQDALLNARLQYASEDFNRTLLQLNLIRAIGDLDPAAAEKLPWKAAQAAPQS